MADFRCEGECLKEENDHDAILKSISEMLMKEEEDLGNKPCMLHDSLALQATEKSLYDALNNDLDQNPESPDDRFTKTGSIATKMVERNPREKKNRSREDNDSTKEQRTNKQLANNVGETEPLEMYDNVLLDVMMQTCSKTEQTKAQKKVGKTKQDVVDLQSLLMQCAQAMANCDSTAVNDLFLRIRHHSSPQGDGTERLAHYFANALEARLAGTGSELYSKFSLDRISAADVLKAYKAYVTAFPLKKMSHLLANKTIEKLATGATTLHIVDFGILHGYQWPCLIQALSERRGGPPKLRITGIDFPQPGFRPAERVANTGLRLEKYCKRFGVPFEYNAIAQKWDTVRAEDLKINKNECLVVNSLYWLHNVLDDETELVVSPRDVVLNLIRSINPDMFVHGVINGNYNTPFFILRFRQALLHYASMFDMLDATMPLGEGNRLLIEQVFGSIVTNIIACEGAERIERPDTYKKWQVRNLKAGFRQLPFDPKTVSIVRSKVEMDYHKDFLVDEDGKWVLQGWKGRVDSAISCWQPAHNRSSS
ncbi:scarecrow-like protein 14 [Phtheirospermum japonicum]|uniref:Scarecrow-like protein 14 n=1 Tax=Phtheirospermum japonicum TaxID=374723 RepID=A0A830CGG1_9LAMI|nr:scarecrow-like protein 14 [Phtheirospermum japonicum]